MARSTPDGRKPMAVTGRTRRPRPSLGRMIPGVGVTAVVAFLVIDLILVSAAVTRTGGGSADEGTAAPAPSATSTDAAASPTPAPSATASTTVAAPTVFLAAGNAEVAWRTTGGSCAGEPARIQTTIDEGRTWDTRSTGSFDARRILALQVESPDVGSIVADVTAACTRTTLQSFTGGEFWRDAPALTATTAYVDPAQPGTVQLVQGPRDAPCDDAVQVVDSGQAAAVLCGSGALHIRSGSGDFRLIDAPGVLALALGTDGILTAGTAGSCAGTSVGRIVPASGAVSVLGCAAAAPTSGSVALSAAGRDVWLLTGDSVSISADGGATW
ncbi:hypothetical protein [Clavibacter michiganensis]|uniref:hypothetical protein n=2 Tax=Clavibacter michiganensis TaxID=28447 RepID=UPI001FB2B00E|nr:hypothetical protein [Clavibacter michiganensis]MDO4019583.1 hypothetical protein [Clavibacter michiganensis]MDO4038045.1 hypothetical protein [Clavibacter michiganensis]MDO4062587.1 hypothetical protein [Clavibacter michiganensis]MDO4076302.1 hypothetical protein [Clavibacter michiganensis]MDO4085661.1 hypothetical protein [Clavibacter michiganensis]